MAEILNNPVSIKYENNYYENECAIKMMESTLWSSYDAYYKGRERTLVH